MTSPSKRMYRAMLGESVSGTGLWHYVHDGEVVEIGDKRLVGIGTGYWEPAENWCDTKQEALLVVADKAETLAAALLEQARKIRAGEVA